MYHVSEIKKISPGKYNVTVNDAVILPLYRSELQRYDIESDSEIPRHIYEDKILPLLCKRCRERSLYLIEKNPKTEQELRLKLARAYYPTEVIDITVSFLKEYGYIDDLQYALRYFNCKKGIKSVMQIKSELIKRGVSRDIISQVIDNTYYDETEAIKRFINKKTTDADLSDRALHNRLYSALRRKGFRHDLIIKCISDICEL